MAIAEILRLQPGHHGRGFFRAAEAARDVAGRVHRAWRGSSRRRAMSHPLTAFTALLCIAMAAGASGALNMAYDSDIDG